jgi:hypothetical protein
MLNYAATGAAFAIIGDYDGICAQARSDAAESLATHANRAGDQ